MSSVLQRDLESIAEYNLPWECLKNSTILITGTTGLIGSLLAKTMAKVNQKHKLNLKILAGVRNVEVARDIFKGYDVQIINWDIRDEIPIKCNLDYIIHCAAVTKSLEMIKYPVELIQTSIYGTENILKLAKEKSIKSMVYLSSMEVYGITDPTLEKITENELGYIDLRNPRSCYGESKRMCESLCSCYFMEYKVPVKIARLAQTFGAGVSKNDNRVFAQFAKSVMNGQDIILHTDGSSTGNYCYTADAIRGILLLLLKGENGEAYNIANEETNVTIREMAEIVAEKIACGNISVITEIPLNNPGYAPKVKMKLSSDKIKDLGWTPSIGLEEMYLKMIEGLKDD